MAQIKHRPGSAYPLGISPAYDGLNFAFHAPCAKSVDLLIFKSGEAISGLPMQRVAGEVFAVCVSGTDAFEYCFLADGEEIFDAHAKAIKHGRAAVPEDEYRWPEDTRPNIQKADLVLYEMHLKGFTAALENGGTFLKAIERIPYLKELGVNGIMLMPVFEFDESVGGYWGYAPKALCAPRESYGKGKALKKLVNALHQSGMEAYLDVGIQGLDIVEAVSHYASEYHIDGFKIASEVDKNLPHLAGCKWFMDYDSAFTDALRRFVKGESGLVYTIATAMEWGGDIVHCAAWHDGLTLHDWAGDVKTAKNALTLALLGRGIPLISMGDEMGRTQNGSKNAYDMDDKTAWLDWKRGKKFQDLQSYVRRLLQLRKDCEALRQSDFCTDYPPVSCHGTTPWQGDFFGRTLGMLYVGRTEAVYVLFNGDDGERLFTLPQGFGWRGVLRADELPFENIGDAILVPSLTAVVLKAECGAT